jgi:predicted TPR repeat methyltransferase
MGSLGFKAKILFTNYVELAKSSIDKFFRRWYTQQHQLTSTTAEDRYPHLFQEAVQAFTKTNSPKILSFGCSTGEECFSLKKYFADAEIIGVDINKRNIRRAVRKNIFSDVRFLHSTGETIKKEGGYNLIFCLSVLCRWEDTKDVANCEKLYPFKKFEEVVASLAESLLPNGLFIIYNSNFRFEDTLTFSNQGFEIVPTSTVNDSGFVHKFDRENNRLRGVHTSCIYRKKST